MGLNLTIAMTWSCLVLVRNDPVTVHKGDQYEEVILVNESKANTISTKMCPLFELFIIEKRN